MAQERMAQEPSKVVAVADDPFAGLTVGRIVHYVPKAPEARYANHAGPWPAMVTDVLRDDKNMVNGNVTLNVNLPVPTAVGDDPVARKKDVPYDAGMVFEHEVEIAGKTEKKRETAHQPGTWHWMFEGQGTRYASNPPSALPKLS